MYVIDYITPQKHIATLPISPTFIKHVCTNVSEHSDGLNLFWKKITRKPCFPQIYHHTLKGTWVKSPSVVILCWESRLEFAFRNLDLQHAEYHKHKNNGWEVFISFTYIVTR